MKSNSCCTSHSRTMPPTSREKPDCGKCSAATNLASTRNTIRLSSIVSNTHPNGSLQQEYSRRRRRWFGHNRRRRRNSASGTTVDDDDDNASANDSMSSSSSSSLEVCNEEVENEDESFQSTVGLAITSTKSLWNDSMSYSDSDVSFSQSVPVVSAVTALSLHHDTAQRYSDDENNDDDDSSLYSNDRYFLTTEEAPQSSFLAGHSLPTTNASSVASVCGGYSIGSGSSSTDNYIFCDDDDEEDDHSDSSDSSSASLREHAPTKQQPLDSTTTKSHMYGGTDQRGRLLAQKLVQQAHYMHHQKLTSSSPVTATMTTTPRVLWGRMRHKLFTKSSCPLDHVSSQENKLHHQNTKNPHRISTLAFSAAAEQQQQLSSDVRNRIIGFEDWEARVAEKNKQSNTKTIASSSPGFLSTSSSSSACSNESIDSTITHHSTSSPNNDRSGGKNHVPTIVHATTSRDQHCWRKYRDGLEDPRPTAEQVADRLGIHEQGRKALEKLRGRVGIIEDLEISTSRRNIPPPPPPPSGWLPWIRIDDDDDIHEDDTSTSTEAHWIPHYEEYVVRAVHHLAQRIFFTMATSTADGENAQFAP